MLFVLPFSNIYQPTRSGRHTFICLTIRHLSKVSHTEIKISSIIKNTSSPPFQRCNYSFIYSTKITCQTYHLHESLKLIQPHCWCCICHKPSNCRDWTQIWRPCDLFLSWWRVNPPTIPPLISSIKKQDFSVEQKKG